MPAIKNNNEKYSNVPLDPTLKSIIDTDHGGWSFFLQPTQIQSVLSKLNHHIRACNFFNCNDEIKIFFDFLKGFIAKNPSNANHLKALNALCKQIHSNIISQPSFNADQLNRVIDYLKLIETMLESDYRYLFNREEISMDARSLKEIAVVVSKNNIISPEFIETYTRLVKGSFDSMRFLNAYRDLDSGIIEIAKNVFLQKDSHIHLLIPKLFGTLAYEIKLLSYYEKKLSIKGSTKTAQQSIVKDMVSLQEYFYSHLHRRDDISTELLKQYFFKDFLKKTGDSSLIDRCKSDLKTYCDADYTPLPKKYSCASNLLSDKRDVIIEYSILAPDQLRIACEAMACAERRHQEWLANIEVSYQHFNQLVSGSDYRFRVFPNRVSYQRDVYAFGWSPYSNGFYTRIALIGSLAKGDGYALWRPDRHGWISVSGHEYAHHLNFAAFRELHRNFDEGLAYVMILGICGDRSYINWLKTNIQHLTSLKPLLKQDFIGYNPSFARMSYLVDKKPSAFSELLRLHQAGNNGRFKEKLAELVRGDTGFNHWLQLQLKTCSAYPLKDLQEGDCPSIQLKDYLPILSTSTVSIGKKISTRAPSPIFYQDYLNLMHAIQQKNLHKVDAVIQKTRYVEFIINYRDSERGFQTPLHYLFSVRRGDCPGELIKLLMSYGANTRLGDKSGITPFQFAAKNCRNWLEVKEIFDHFSPRNTVNTTTSVPTTTTSVPIPPTTTTTPVPISTTTTSLTPYKEKKPYEYPIVIHGSMSLFKGTFTALSRFGFEKLQKNCLFVHRHPTLFFVAKPMMESMLLSTMNLLYFPSSKGMVSDLSEFTSAGIHFSMDLALMFGFSLINSKLQPLLDSAGEKDSWMQWFFKKLGSSSLFTLFFLLSNLSLILGENFQDHKEEVLLTIFLNAILTSFIHQTAYYGINSVTNGWNKKSEEGSVTQHELNTMLLPINPPATAKGSNRHRLFSMETAIDKPPTCLKEASSSRPRVF